MRDLQTFYDYEEEVWRRGEPEGQSLLTLGGLGIAGEADEVADEIKKVVFHDRPLDRLKVLSEVGDVLWYAMAVCKALGFTLQDAAEANAAKLRIRYPQGFNAADSAARRDVDGEWQAADPGQPEPETSQRGGQ